MPLNAPLFRYKPKSLRNVELETGVSKSSVQRIILKNLVHNLVEDDRNGVVEFSSRIIEFLDFDPDFHRFAPVNLKELTFSQNLFRAFTSLQRV